MTNTTINKRLELLQDKVIDLRCDVEEEIDAIQEKMDAIEERASERESGEMTDREQERYDALEERRDALQDLVDDYLSINFEDNLLDEE